MGRDYAVTAVEVHPTSPVCNPCLVTFDQKCKPDPEVIDPGTGYGTMDCTDSHCAPFKVFCRY
jgi:hypothetical protein